MSNSVFRAGGFGAACLWGLLLVVAPAHAGRISIDFGDGNFDQSGNSFSLLNTTEQDLRSDGSAAVAIGFDLNFGTGTTYSSLYVSENGIVSFGNALGAYANVATLDALGAPVIAAYYSDLTSIAPTGQPLDLTAGTITTTRGIADPLADVLGQYSAAEAVDALRITWVGLLASDQTTRVYTQLLLYRAGAAGDFDMRLAYGSVFGDSPTSTDGALAGFSLGGNAASITGGLLSATDYFYSFRNGALVNGGGGGDGGGTPVPEPATAGLLFLGLAAAGFARRRR